MQTWLLKKLGAIAGLAGISLGILLILYRRVLELELFSKIGLTSDQAYKIIITLLVLTFGAATVGIVAWISVSRNDKEDLVARDQARTPAALAAIILLLLVGLLWGRGDEPTPPAPNIPNTIDIQWATYFSKWDAAKHTDISTHLKTTCNSRQQCDFACDNKRSGGGDPAKTNPKLCSVFYTCAKTPSVRQVQTVWEDPVALNHLSCP